MSIVINQKFLRKFISYFFVGGFSAIVEWGFFFIFSSLFKIYYLLSTFLAFCISTSTNWILGRTFTFKDINKYKNKKLSEFVFIFIASFICLLINFLIMYILVDKFKFNSYDEKFLCKIFATGVAFIGNFSIRIFLVYK